MNEEKEEGGGGDSNCDDEDVDVNANNDVDSDDEIPPPLPVENAATVVAPLIQNDEVVNGAADNNSIASSRNDDHHHHHHDDCGDHRVEEEEEVEEQQDVSTTTEPTFTVSVPTTSAATSPSTFEPTNTPAADITAATSTIANNPQQVRNEKNSNKENTGTRGFPTTSIDSSISHHSEEVESSSSAAAAAAAITSSPVVSSSAVATTSSPASSNQHQEHSTTATTTVKEQQQRINNNFGATKSSVTATCSSASGAAAAAAAGAATVDGGTVSTSSGGKHTQAASMMAAGDVVKTSKRLVLSTSTTTTRRTSTSAELQERTECTNGHFESRPGAFAVNSQSGQVEEDDHLSSDGPQQRRRLMSQRQAVATTTTTTSNTGIAAGFSSRPPVANDDNVNRRHNDQAAGIKDSVAASNVDESLPRRRREERDTTFGDDTDDGWDNYHNARSDNSNGNTNEDRNSNHQNGHNDNHQYHHHHHLVEANLVEVLPPTVHAVSVYIDEEDDPMHHHHHHHQYHPSSVVSAGNGGGGSEGRSSRAILSSSPTNQVSPFEMEQHHQGDQGDNSHHTNARDQDRGKNGLPSWLSCPRWCQKWQYRAIFWAGVSLLILILALVFLIDQDGYDPDGFSRWNPPPSFPPPPPEPVVTCYNSTRDLFLAQVYDYVESDFTTTADEYVMCRGSTVDVGVLRNPAIGDFRYVDGDYPIVILQPNTTIRCGGSGRGSDGGDVKNDNDKYDDNDRRPELSDGDPSTAASEIESHKLCTLKGGFMQVSMVGYVESYFDMDGAQGQDRVNLQVAKEILSTQVVKLDNVTIEGMTFVGNIETVSNFPGSSVIMGQPGNVDFINCQWTNMTATSGVISMFEIEQLKILNDTLFSLPRLTSQIVLKQCLFDEIVYENPILMVAEQRLHVEGTMFRNLSPSPFSKGRECTFEWLDPFSSTTTTTDGNNGFDQTLVFEEGCTNLMTCAFRSQCSITNSCFINVDSSASLGLILMAEHGTVVSNAGSSSSTVTMFDVNATLDDATSIASSYRNYIDEYSRSNTACTFLVSATTDGGSANLEGSRTCLDNIPFGGDSSQCTIGTTVRRRDRQLGTTAPNILNQYGSTP